MDEPAIVVVETPPSEHLEMAQTEAAVEIAEIAAERDVAIAEINAATTEMVVAADTASDDEDALWLRTELETLRAASETHGVTLSEAMGRIVMLETANANLTETVTMQAAALLILSPPSPAETGTEEPAPDTTSAAVSEANTEPETTAAIRKRRWM